MNYPFQTRGGGILPLNLQKSTSKPCRKLKFGMLAYVNPTFEGQNFGGSKMFGVKFSGGQNLLVVKIFEGQNFWGSKFVGVQIFWGAQQIFGSKLGK